MSIAGKAGKMSVSDGSGRDELERVFDTAM